MNSKEGDDKVKPILAISILVSSMFFLLGFMYINDYRSNLDDVKEVQLGIEKLKNDLSNTESLETKKILVNNYCSDLLDKFIRERKIDSKLINIVEDSKDYPESDLDFDISYTCEKAARRDSSFDSMLPDFVRALDNMSSVKYSFFDYLRYDKRAIYPSSLLILVIPSFFLFLVNLTKGRSAKYLKTAELSSYMDQQLNNSKMSAKLLIVFYPMYFLVSTYSIYYRRLFDQGSFIFVYIPLIVTTIFSIFAWIKVSKTHYDDVNKDFFKSYIEKDYISEVDFFKSYVKNVKNFQKYGVKLVFIPFFGLCLISIITLLIGVFVSILI